MRIAVVVILVAGLASLAAYAANESSTGDHGMLPAPELDQHGLYQQPWLAKNTLRLQTAPRRAANDGKTLMLLWEQRGCHYCQELHNVNFRIPVIASYIADRFVVHQMNMRSDEQVGDVTGNRISQRRLAGRNGVRGTPTIQFIGADGQEVFRLPGYAKPPIFLAALEYVAVKGYETAGFRDWVQEKIARMRARQNAE